MTTTNALQIKEVDFNDDKLMAVQNENGIFTVVRHICECIGLTNGQSRRQVENIQSDLVLKQGVANLRIPTKGGSQATLCLAINYLPLWLAKISITPKMQEEKPELVKKLIAYQLKAKDVLAQAFLPNQNQQHPKQYSTCQFINSSIQQLQLDYKSLSDYVYEHCVEIGTLIDKVDYLEEKSNKHLPYQTPQLESAYQERSSIKHLAILRNDKSIYNGVTYREIYKRMMPEDKWKRILNKHRRKHGILKTSKPEIISDNIKLQALFNNTVKQMINKLEGK